MRRRLSTFTILISVFCIILLAVNLYEIHWLQNEHMQYHHHHSEESSKQTDKLESTKASTLANNDKNPKFVAFGRDINSGFLKHVFYTFEHFGYLRDDINSTDDWDVLWAHDYPFTKLRPKMLALKPYQRVNHFPGSGFITNKQDLATSGIKYVPKAFKIPEQTKQLKDYVSKNPQKMFVQKSNDHRGIKIEKLEKLNLKQNGSFVQEFVDKPLLVDGHKFDIGVYTIITSIDPLIVYIYNGDILFRYCPVKYYPFDPKVLDKYVVGDDYLPTWEVPSLKEYFNDYGYNMRDSFNAYIRKTGKNPDKMWVQIEDAIRSACLSKEYAIQKILTMYPSKRNFFEMVRFDFAVDDDLNVYIMEANMSPNLSSAHFPPNRVLYEQVLFSLFSLVGLATHQRRMNLVTRDNVQVSERNLMTDQQPICFNSVKCGDCVLEECQLCFSCISDSKNSIQILKKAYSEHVQRRDCKRVFPPSFDYATVNATVIPEDLSSSNKFLFRWFKEKCIIDRSWC